MIESGHKGEIKPLPLLRFTRGKSIFSSDCSLIFKSSQSVFVDLFFCREVSQTCFTEQQAKPEPPQKTNKGGQTPRRVESRSGTCPPRPSPWDDTELTEQLAVAIANETGRAAHTVSLNSTPVAVQIVFQGVIPPSTPWSPPPPQPHSEAGPSCYCLNWAWGFGSMSRSNQSQVFILRRYRETT